MLCVHQEFVTSMLRVCYVFINGLLRVCQKFVTSMLCVHQEFVKGVSEVCYECVITAKIVNKKIGIIFVQAFIRSH
jgi:hypothetical protein